MCLEVSGSFSDITDTTACTRQLEIFQFPEIEIQVLSIVVWLHKLIFLSLCLFSKKRANTPKCKKSSSWKEKPFTWLLNF